MESLLMSPLPAARTHRPAIHKRMLLHRLFILALFIALGGGAAWTQASSTATGQLSNFAVTNITHNSATISWSDSDASAGYAMVQVNGTDVAKNVMAQIVTLTNLKPDTVQNIRILKISSDSNIVDNLKASFRTQGVPLPSTALSNLRISNISYATARVDWDDARQM